MSSTSSNILFSKEHWKALTRKLVLDAMPQTPDKFFRRLPCADNSIQVNQSSYQGQKEHGIMTWRFTSVGAQELQMARNWAYHFCSPCLLMSELLGQAMSSARSLGKERGCSLIVTRRKNAWKTWWMSCTTQISTNPLWPRCAVIPA